MLRVFTKTIGRKLGNSFAALLLFLLVVRGVGIAGILTIRNDMQGIMNVNLQIN
ncbi:MAG: hypothetical protein ABI700_14985 [Chloroflexota bacterium]